MEFMKKIEEFKDLLLETFNNNNEGKKNGI